MIPALLDIKAKANVPMTFRVVLELGDVHTPATNEAVKEINGLLIGLSEAFQLA